MCKTVSDILQFYMHMDTPESLPGKETQICGSSLKNSAIQRSDIFSEALPPHFSQDNFNTYAHVPEELSAVFLPEKCKSFLVGKTSIGKTPLHVETNSSLYFGQYLVLGRGWLLFQPAHFVMESSSFGFCFFKELWRSDQASATRPHCVFPLEKPSFTAVS